LRIREFAKNSRWALPQPLGRVTGREYAEGVAGALNRGLPPPKQGNPTASRCPLGFCTDLDLAAVNKVDRWIEDGVHEFLRQFLGPHSTNDRWRQQQDSEFWQ
jgi:hypothetical protein